VLVFILSLPRVSASCRDLQAGSLRSPEVEAEKFVKSFCRLSATRQLAADDLLKSAKPGRFPQYAGRVRYPYRGQRLRSFRKRAGPARVPAMKRFLLVILLGAIAALTAYYIVRQHPAALPSTIANLLPAETALFIHIPDAEKNRDAWHRTDLYQLYREPAVQDFLQKPISRLPEKGPVKEAWRDLASLRLRNAFLATNNFDSLRVVGGFEFRCTDKEAESVIERWKSQLATKAPGSQRSSADYEKHHIDIFSSGQYTFASTITGHQFFAAATVEDLQALLDRVDGRTKTPALDSDANFRAAMKQMPADYAWMFYLQPKQLAQKLATLRAQSGRSLRPDQQTMIERIQSFSHAMVFEGGKIRDIGFAAMPRVAENKLERTTLALASADTLLYSAFIVNMQQQFEWALEPAGAGSMAAPLQLISNALSSAGVTKEDWKAAFGDEISLMAAWPASAKLPNAILTVAVRDSGRARRIAGAIASSSGWQKSSRNNAEYYTAPTSGVLITVSPTVAVSDRLLVLGLDPASVDRIVTHAPVGNGLTGSENFHAASKLVPEPQQMFAYIDLATLYSRLDTTLRPILQMSAAFVPSLSERLDPNKLPPTEVITKHLSPVVASQSYVDGGYRSESAGTITIGQAAIAAGATYAGVMIFQHQQKGPSPFVAAPASPTPSPTIAQPSPTP